MHQNNENNMVALIILGNVNTRKRFTIGVQDTILSLKVSGVM